MAYMKMCHYLIMNEVEAQFLEGELLGELGLKESRAFRREIEKISREVFGV